jgi:hypothetical protein
MLSMDSIPPQPPLCIPPRFRDARGIFAPGELRLRSRAAADLARAAEQARGSGEVRLHSTAPQRRHANPRREGVA